MGFPYEKREIVDYTIAERPEGRLVHIIYRQIMRTREFPHLFSASAIKT
jgi:hypothetical protein